MSIQNKNILINNEEIIKYLGKFKIKYWVTLNLPMVLREKDYDVKFFNKHLFEHFMRKLEMISQDKNLFIFGTIENYYLKKGYHAHVVLSCNKQEYVIKRAWVETLIEISAVLLFKGDNKKAEDLIKKANEEMTLMYCVNLVLSKESLDIKVNYMLKMFGFHKGHGYFCNKNDIELISNLETEHYKEFIKLDYDKGLSFVVFIYALSDLFTWKLSYNFVIQLISEKKLIIDEICEHIDSYLVEQYENIFEHKNKVENFKLFLQQIAIELSQSELFFSLRPNFSFKKKLDINEDLKILLKKYKKNQGVTYYDYIIKFFDEGLNDYKEECRLWLKEKESKVILKTKFSTWLEDLLKGEDYFFDIAHNIISWMIVSACSEVSKPFSQEFLVKQFKKIWSYYLSTFSKKRVLHLEFSDYFLLLKIIVEVVESKLKIKNLLWEKRGKNIHVARDDVQVRRIMEVQALGRKMLSIYSEVFEEKKTLRIYARTKNIKYK